MQTRKRSLYESFVSQVCGLAYAIPLNWYLFSRLITLDPWIYAVTNTLCFLFAGMAFKYCVRRFFNWFDEKYPAS